MFVDESFDDIDNAITWARSRAPQVFVDVTRAYMDSMRYLIGLAPADMHRWRMEHWPHPLPAEPPHRDDYRGTAYVTDEARWDNVGYDAIHRQDGLEVERSEHGTFDLEGAIDWGRECARVVIVEILPDSISAPPPPRVTRYSAGSDDPPEESLPRLRPREGEIAMKWRATFQDSTLYVLEAPTRTIARHEATRRYIRQKKLRPPPGYSAFGVPSPHVEPEETP